MSEILICPHCGKEIKCHCQQCGHDFTPRTNSRPAQCPKCHSYKWDSPPGATQSRLKVEL